MLHLKPRVLIADSEPIIADTLAQIFVNEGFEAKAFYDVETAMAAADRWPPDLAVLDSFFYLMSGELVKGHLRVDRPHCGIILLSPHIAFPVDAISDSRVEVLPKPVPPQELLATARKFLEADY